MPSSFDDAFGFCEDILGQPHCQIVEPGERHWGIFKRLCIETNTRGPRVTDAWFAALAIEWGCEWITMDRDFARFAGLKWAVPQARAAQPAPGAGLSARPSRLRRPLARHARRY